jgi:tight adherence protein B
MDYLFYIFAILIFVAVVLLVEALYLSWNATKGPEAGRIARRLRVLAAGGGAPAASMIRNRLLSQTPSLQRLLLEVPRVNAFDRFLEQSGLSWSVADCCALMLAALVVALAATGYAGLPWVICLSAGGVAVLLPIWYVKRTKTKRLQRIELQLPDALDLMSRAMRAGHAFPTALKMVSEEMSAPIGSEFRVAIDEVNFGVAIPAALMNLADRIPSTDLRYFVIAVLIQRETGGNLTQLLDSISRIIRARINLLGQVRVLSAEGRLSAWILSLLPFGVGAMVQLTNPQFLAVLFIDPAGRKMLVGAALLMLVGIAIMRKVIRIRI